jgi:hypothetical protein
MLPQLASVAGVSQLAKAACIGALQKSTVGAARSKHVCHPATLAAESVSPASVLGSDRTFELDSITLGPGRRPWTRQNGCCCVGSSSRQGFHIAGDDAAADQGWKEFRLLP